jgi:hypothetical protein
VSVNKWLLHLEVMNGEGAGSFRSRSLGGELAALTRSWFSLTMGLLASCKLQRDRRHPSLFGVWLLALW